MYRQVGMGNVKATLTPGIRPKTPNQLLAINGAKINLLSHIIINKNKWPNHHDKAT